MKKLMMAAAIVCAAVAAQAASIDWSVGSGWKLQDGLTKPAKGYTVYLINAASQSAIVDALNDGSFSASTAGVLGSATTTNTKGAVDAATATSASLTAGTSYNYKLLVLDTTSKAGTTYYTITSAEAKAAYDKADPTYSEPMSIAFSTANFNAGTGWTAASSVPEPTSAMLLLLGVAGLALRRKQKQA